MASWALTAGDVIVNEIMYHPASQRSEEEWIELHNAGSAPVNLAQWRLTAGVEFVFPPIVIPPGGFLVVAAEDGAFAAGHPTVSNRVAGWRGRLSDNGETLTLRNATGVVQDMVDYATEGDWAVRGRGPDDRGHRGWAWYALSAGFGRSAERINPRVREDSGQNWASSAKEGGTPGATNSVAAADTAPLVLDVRHTPAVPRSNVPVFVNARVLDDQPGPLTTRVRHRLDGQLEFEATPMLDDGLHGDGQAGDGEFGAMLPAQPQDTIVEFYVEASDASGRTRTWPAAIQPDNVQLANCLYQVDDRPYTSPQPLHRVVMTAAEQAELAEIDAMPWYWSSNAEMNGTFISAEAGETETRYTIGFRLRGTTSRAMDVKSRRVNFNTDRRWRGLRAINLNSVNPHAQIMGSVLSRRAGLPAARARAVQLRENNRQRVPSSTVPFGVYAEMEVLNSEFTDRQFPADGAGNLYQAIGKGNLDYLEDPKLYEGWEYYEKLTNTAEYDWTDLIELTRVLNLTPAESWFEALGRVADIQEWVTYFAVNTVLANTETSLGTGGPGDYALYRGIADPRFRLVIHDLDSVLGVYGGLDAPLLRATNNPAIRHFLGAAEVAPLYFAELRRLVDRDLAPEAVADLMQQFLGDFAPPEAIRAMQDVYQARAAFIRARLPDVLEVNVSLPVVEGVQISDNAVMALTGKADLARTRAVRVSGAPADWDPLSGQWTLNAQALLPGMNRLLVQSLDATGAVLGEEVRRVWYRGGPRATRAGNLPADTLWTAAAGTSVITNDVVVPSGVTLTIEPGTTVFFQRNTRLLVRGRLVAEGTPERRIHFGREPGAAFVWSGLRFEDSRENRIRHADIAYHNDPALFLTNAALRVEHVTFLGSFGSVVWGEDSSFVARGCEFPDMPYGEHVRLLHIPPDGEWLLDGNVFGTTAGYADILDVTGPKRPGPILRVLNNVFRGGADDGLDLDGVDAHIEGNVFMHFHKNNDSTSESSAIATGTYEGRTSDLVIARNVFFDNDHDILLKEGARVMAANNTFAGATKATLLINEPDRPGEAPPRSGLIEDSILWNTRAVVRNLDPALLENGTVHLEIRRSLIPETGPWSGSGNMLADPRFADANNDFRLLPGSLAGGAGEGGVDLGAHVPAGAVISGTPPPTTWRREATIRVTGAGLTHFRWKLDEGSWSDALPIGSTVALTHLEETNHQFFAIGLDSAGVWQSESEPAASPPWLVSQAVAGVRINEILAWNQSAWPAAGSLPDFVELYNDSPVPADLGGLSLTDDPLEPRRFVFPAGTSLASGGYLVIRLVPGAGVGALTAGFGLDHDGDELHLFDRPGGRGLLASVRFGPQLPDHSIGDRGDGAWTLNVPTPGAPNLLQRLGDPAAVRFSEWLARPGPAWESDFIELYNPDDFPVNLNGLGLSREPVGLPFEAMFPPLSFLPAHGYGVFQADATVPPRASHLPFRLPGEQGTLALVAPDGHWLDWVAYGAQLPGVSQGRQPGGGTAIVSLPVPTPGTGMDGLPGAGTVVLCEWLANNVTLTNDTGAASDWVELHNRGTNWVSLAGLSLSDRLADPQKWMFPGESMLPPGGYLVVACEAALPPSSTNTGFGLAAEGESLHLFDSGGQLLDTVTFGSQAADFALVRLPEVPSTWRLALPTPGGPNQSAETADPSGLRINEWMADPSSGPDWLELHNTSAQPVAIEGLWLSDSASNPSKFQFPPLSFLAGAEHGFLALIADEDTEQGPSHLPFRLSAQGEAILLSRADSSRLDEVVFGRQRPDVSQGRLPDGGGTVRDLAAGGSPGGPNALNARPVVAPIPDQRLVAGEPWELRSVASDPDPGQSFAFGLRPPFPEGLTIEPTTGWIRWTPPLPLAGLVFEVTIEVTDNGSPPQRGRATFGLSVAEPEMPPAWNLPWRDSAGNLYLTWTARPGARYAVDIADEIARPDWTRYREVLAAGSDVLLVVPWEEGTPRFFRLQRLP